MSFKGCKLVDCKSEAYKSVDLLTEIFKFWKTIIDFLYFLLTNFVFVDLLQKFDVEYRQKGKKNCDLYFAITPTHPPPTPCRSVDLEKVTEILP